MPSISSCLLTVTTAFRNPNGTEFHWSKLPPADLQRAKKWKVLIAQVSYLAIVPIALFEIAVSQVARLTAACVVYDLAKRHAINRWAQSSLFSLLWAATAFMSNPFANDMISTERIARMYFTKAHTLYSPSEHTI